MEILGRTGTDQLANVYIASYGENKLIEFVESIQPPLTRDKKWVLIVSTLFGCPIGCGFCDAGREYHGKLSEEQIFAQIDYLIESRFETKHIPVDKLKIQFARMGDPALNNSVLSVLKNLPVRYDAPGLMPCISTIAPKGCDSFMEELLEIKQSLYTGQFQLQFSLHSLDEKRRDQIIPVKKWSLEKIAEYGERFFETTQHSIFHGVRVKTDRKITLNFALSDKEEIDINALRKYFDPNVFLVKVTPINPTISAIENSIKSKNLDSSCCEKIKDNLRDAGYDVIISIGELDENLIGSNCGQHVTFYKNSGKSMDNSYTYQMEGV